MNLPRSADRDRHGSFSQRAIRPPTRGLGLYVTRQSHLSRLRIAGQLREPHVSLIVAWIAFPLVLALVGAGWGAIVQRAADVQVGGALLVPLGLAATIVVAGTLTAFSAAAPAAVPVALLGALLGLIFCRPDWRLGRWPLLAAVGVLVVYGAPVLLSGQATFTGFLKLDDTATWFNVIDHVMTHGQSVSGQPPSTYSLVFTGDVGTAYPLGSFMLPGVARAVVRTDIAWVFQPYLACCGAAVALSLYGLTEELIASPRVRALVAFVAAQSSLLYGYSLWGGIKELTASFLLALGSALVVVLLARRPSRPRELLPLAIAAGALIQTLGVGAGGWVAPAVVMLVGVWLYRGRRSPAERRGTAASIAWLGAMTAAAIVPIWVVLHSFVGSGLAAGLFSSDQTTATKLGNLLHPLSIFQLAGIWPVGDFRLDAPALSGALLIGLVVIASAVGLSVGVRRRRFGVAVYVGIALIGCAAAYAVGATPWVTAKTLAICSPALLVAALCGATVLWERFRAGVIVLVVITGGVVWSNVLAYHDVTLAPRPALSELAHIGGLVAGKGPTFINEYDVYADRHFLRAGAPVEPAEYRQALLPLRDGAVLTKAAWADLDSFAVSTIEPYRSIVLRRSPVQSRPPSIYRLVWQGRYYELWQRPLRPAVQIVEHVPLGQSNVLPYCGAASNAAQRPLCSVDPVATPPCAQIIGLGAAARRRGASLVAYQRPAPIVARGDQTLWPESWGHDPAAHTLTPDAPGTAVTHIQLATEQSYAVWLEGSFARGFEVGVDGHPLGTVKDELSTLDGWVRVADVKLSAGVHTFTLTYPHADLTPGSGDNSFTSLSALALEPQQTPVSRLITVPASRARQLCGRSLDWIELVTG